MRVAIIGANGQLGMDLMKAFGDLDTVPLNHGDIEISDMDSVSRVLSLMKPAVIVNTAAYHKVDDCEKNPERSFQVNAIGALNLARVAQDLKSELVHISTDYVFDGKKAQPYVETDLPRPLNVYAASKVAGEHFIAAYSERHYVVRSSGLYGHNKCRAKGRNFIDTMLALARDGKEIRVVQDEVLTPTYTYHLALQVRELVKTGSYGLYHATNNGECSWYEFAGEIFKNAGLKPNVQPVSAKQFPSPIKRPSYSVLDNAALRPLGIEKMPHWKESLEHYFKNKPLGN